jgi:hypothetical protein
MNYKNTADFALSLDAKDELRTYRDTFHIPLQKKWRRAYLHVW